MATKSHTTVEAVEGVSRYGTPIVGLNLLKYRGHVVQGDPIPKQALHRNAIPLSPLNIHIVIH
ncbi:hypothetical protein RRF57_001120 [Xylaria bambusicola]|uniref:Uncharacterized protein n=1 Tax=Xylaria bambusicola TaxID=326684 RepID=A0AAN7UB06_9PEZI